MLMRSISGIRGIVGETFTPDVVVKYVHAFLKVTNAKKVVIGRDSRPTGEHYEQLVSGICRLAGAEVVSLGISSTPTVELMVEELKAQGGIIITASHNPVEWNALKFLKADGTFLGQSEIDELFDIVDNQEMSWPDFTHAADIETGLDGDEFHVKNALELPFVDVDLIKSCKFKVAVDAVNGAGSRVVPMLLKELGCEVFEIYTKPDGTFPRGPEPTPENLKNLEQFVLDNNCSVGFALDPDADRCALVSSEGKAIGEEYTLAISTDAVLSQKAGTVTINLSTSRMVEDVADKYGQKTERSKVGEINVSMLMKENNSIIGGEGNGGVILPASHYGRDSVVSAILVLQWMAQNKQNIEDYVKNNPSYVMLKEKVQLKAKPDVSMYQKIADHKKGTGIIDLQDGVRIDRNKSWVHLRASNTEPIMRIISEAPTKEEAQKLYQEFANEL